MAAPVIVVAMDRSFHAQMATQFPAVLGAARMYADNAQLAHATALCNTSLQGAYLMMVARIE